MNDFLTKIIYSHSWCFRVWICVSTSSFSPLQAAAAAMDPGGLNGGAGLGGGIPESTRYPWMSITGKRMPGNTCQANTDTWEQILIPESKRYPWMYIVHICPTQVGVRSTQAYKGTPQCGWLYLGEYLDIPENTRGDTYILAIEEYLGMFDSQ